MYPWMGMDFLKPLWATITLRKSNSISTIYLTASIWVENLFLQILNHFWKVKKKSVLFHSEFSADNSIISTPATDNCYLDLVIFPSNYLINHFAILIYLAALTSIMVHIKSLVYLISGQWASRCCLHSRILLLFLLVLWDLLVRIPDVPFCILHIIYIDLLACL